MKVNNETQYIKIPFNSSSFLDLINGGGKTNAGKAAWKSLIPGSELQEKCDDEGFSIEEVNESYGSQIKVRFGILTNHKHPCSGHDSCIGFGITARGCSFGGIVDDIIERKTTCGNLAICGYFNLLDIPAFGYILVK